MINRIKQIIDECVKHILTEMFSDKIYHFTNEKGLIDILVNDAKYDFVMRWFKDFMSRPEIMNSPLATKIKVFYDRDEFNK